MQLRIVLVGTSHPGNIGSVARAMKTMGAAELYLVAPKVLPDIKSTVLASHATDVLDAAVVVKTLPEALTSCDRVLGTSARPRTVDGANVTVRDSMDTLQGMSRVAIVFGRESSGLTNAELDVCDARIHIPANPDYSSLNLAQAVQVVTYEWYQQFGPQAPVPIPEHEWDKLADHQSFHHFLTHFEKTIKQVGFLSEEEPGHVMRRMKDLFARAKPSQREVNILRGILTKIERRFKRD